MSPAVVAAAFLEGGWRFGLVARSVETAWIEKTGSAFLRNVIKRDGTSSQGNTGCSHSSENSKKYHMYA
jgi:hypothetical protein